MDIITNLEDEDVRNYVTELATDLRKEVCLRYGINDPDIQTLIPLGNLREIESKVKLLAGRLKPEEKQKTDGDESDDERKNGRKNLVHSYSRQQYPLPKIAEK